MVSQQREFEKAHGAPLRVPTFPGGPWVYLRSWTQGADGWRREPLHGNPHAISAVNGSGVCWGVGEKGAPALPPFIVYGETVAECAAKLDAERGPRVAALRGRVRASPGIEHGGPLDGVATLDGGEEER